MKIVEKGLTSNMPTILCGDFNFDRKVQNDLTKMLKSRGFTQIVKEPTTYRGYCIDHIYQNISEKKEGIICDLHRPYYSDHEAVCVRIPALSKMGKN